MTVSPSLKSPTGSRSTCEDEDRAMSNPYQIELVRLVEAIGENEDAVRALEAGCDGEGPYARACEVIGRQPKWPADWDMGDLVEDDED